jgi:hypothetical protein
VPQNINPLGNRAIWEDANNSVQGQLWVSGRQWCDFVSFDPRINGSSNYFCVRVERDEAFIAELEAKVKQFENELLELLEKLK